MISKRGFKAAFAAMVLLGSAACRNDAGASASADQAAAKVTVTVQTAGGPRIFNVDVARTSAEQERGLMYRTNIPADGGMIFTPYPAAGGGPREASFWMKTTPSRNGRGLSSMNTSFASSTGHHASCMSSRSYNHTGSSRC